MRNITPETFADEFFGTLPMPYRVLWIGLITNIADDQGRMLDNAALIRSLIFPYDQKITVMDIDKALKLFEKKHKILRYRAGTNGSGRQLIQILNWWRYQKSAQWAGKSQYPAPDNWADRIRIHVAGGGGQPYTLNWDCEGGFIAATKKLRSPFKGDTPKTKITPKIKIKKPTTHIPPSTKQEGRGLVGGLDGSEFESTAFTPLERKIAKSIQPIFQSAGLGQSRFETLLHKVATRSFIPNAIAVSLAALASCYADDKINNKVIVAVHRLEENKVPAEYFDPARWKKIPASVLKSAGIDDLEGYIRSHGNAQDRKVAALRSRSRSQEDEE